MKHSKGDLQQMQSLPLSAKIIMTQQRIKAWYEHWYGEVYVSFSGGKDSTVLLHLAREIYPDIEAVFVNTGLEYPEIQQFVKTFDNVTILRPEMRFDEVIKKYGYPMIGKEVASCIAQGRKALEKNDGTYTYRLKRLNGELLDKDGNKSIFNAEKYKPLLYTDFVCSHECCNVMKKKPAKKFEKETGKKPITAQMASESKLREMKWRQNGCNGFDMKHPMSNPMAFWTDQDVLQYIKEKNLPIASVYGEIEYAENPDQIRFDDYGFEFGREKLRTTGCERTGCIFCGFGCHLDERGGGQSRFVRLKETHPRQYEYCIGGGEYNEKGVWQPSKQGLGLGKVIDDLNEIYGDGFIKY